MPAEPSQRRIIGDVVFDFARPHRLDFFLLREAFASAVMYFVSPSIKQRVRAHLGGHSPRRRIALLGGCFFYANLSGSKMCRRELNAVVDPADWAPTAETQRRDWSKIAGLTYWEAIEARWPENVLSLTEKNIACDGLPSATLCAKVQYSRHIYFICIQMISVDDQMRSTLNAL